MVPVILTQAALSVRPGHIDCSHLPLASMARSTGRSLEWRPIGQTVEAPAAPSRERAARSPKGMFFSACRYSGYPGYPRQHPSSRVEGIGPPAECRWHHQSMPRGDDPTMHRSIGCGLGGVVSVVGPMRSTAGASRGTVPGGSRNTGNPRLRGRKTLSGQIACWAPKTPAPSPLAVECRVVPVAQVALPAGFCENRRTSMRGVRGRMSSSLRQDVVTDVVDSGIPNFHISLIFKSDTVADATSHRRLSIPAWHCAVFLWRGVGSGVGDCAGDVSRASSLSERV